MGALDAADEAAKLQARGLTDERTLKILTHFSHNGALTHTQLCRRAGRYGFAVAYDGYT